MTASELQRLLLERYPVENERHEWKAWRSLKQNVSGRKGEDLISYLSALANMDGGVVVIGAEDSTLVPTGIEDFAGYTAEDLPHRLLGNCLNLPSLGLRIEPLQASDTGRTVWLVHVPRHLPRKPVSAHNKAWQRDVGSLVELREERLNAILAEPLVGEDWSAVTVAGARLDDLEPAALVLAREQFARKHSRERWAAEIPQWSDLQFLDKARLTVHGSITRAALLLLGRPESARMLSPHPAEITWRLAEERVVEHFGPPFLLTTTEVLRRIRNPNIKLFPATELIATELPRYEVRVVLEALHNCVAHQDYARGARIVVEEAAGRLRFTNAGAFFDGRPEDYFAGQRTPQVYRNPWLASAMNGIGMIDKAGFGISDMVSTQRRRFLPLPDYAGSTLDSTVFNVFGQTLDENYSRLLMTRSELSVEQVVWLDRIQKRLPIDDAHAAALRQAGLIEGRKPNWHVSAKVADLTNQRAEYMRTRGLDDRALKVLVIDYVRKFESVTGTELRRFVLGKLPEVLTEAQKLYKVRNLLTALRKRGVDGWRIEADKRGQGARWTLRKD
jgi:ATP-dependent DNA helicase RecG